ncbi:MAG TPA: hypothetical protein VF815_44685 [Myxococcaceae bacterium]|jgi:hypothetical protein
MLTIVVARYKEDVAWLNDLPADWRVYLYNKGPAIAPGTLRRPGIEVRALPNHGLEASAYLYHLRHHFNAGEGEFTVFTQADPFPHSPGFLQLLDVAAGWRDIQPLSVQWLAAKNVPPRHLLLKDRRAWVGDIPVYTEYFSLHTCTPVAYFDVAAWRLFTQYRVDHNLGSGDNLVEHFFELCGLQWLADEVRGADVGVFSYGAIFGVRNSRVAAFLERARPHLERMELLTRSALVFSYMLERCWLHLFGEPVIRFAPLHSPNAAAPVAESEVPKTFIETDATTLADAELAALRTPHYEVWGGVGGPDPKVWGGWGRPDPKP